MNMIIVSESYTRPNKGLLVAPLHEDFSEFAPDKQYHRASPTTIFVSQGGLFGIRNKPWGSTNFEPLKISEIEAILEESKHQF
jgi:hypothetical protein